MAGIGLSGDERWLDDQMGDAPEALRERALFYLECGDGPLPARLGRAAHAALEAVLVRPGDRSVALDLLAADALVTLALKAQAVENPAGLHRFAEELLGD
jgi:hypothetical protein